MEKPEKQWEEEREELRKGKEETNFTTLKMEEENENEEDEEDGSEGMPK